MASTITSNKGVATKAGGGGNKAVLDLLDSIVKKAGFKQLAGYSIKCLSGLLQTNRMGWDLLAKTAYDNGGIGSVVTVLLKYANDVELVSQGLSACNSMITVAPSDSSVNETLPTAYSFAEAIWKSDISPADKTSLLADAIEFVLAVTKKASNAPHDTFLPTLSDITAEISRGWASGCNGFLLAAVARLLFAMVGSREGTAAVLGHEGMLPNLLQAAKTVAEKYTQTATTASKAAVKGVKSSASDHIAVLRAMIDPLFRFLDRLSRVQDGMLKLRGCDAFLSTLHLVDWWLHSGEAHTPAAGTQTAAGVQMQGQGQDGAQRMAASAALDLFNRIVEDQMPRLLSFVDSANTTAATVSAEQAARLFARLCEIQDRLAAVAKDVPLLKTNLRFLRARVQAIHSSANNDEQNGHLNVATALFIVWQRIMERGPKGVSRLGGTNLLKLGGLNTLLDALGVACTLPASLHSMACASIAFRVLYTLLNACHDTCVLTSSGAYTKDGREGATTTANYVWGYSQAQTLPGIHEKLTVISKKVGFSTDIPMMMMIIRFGAQNACMLQSPKNAEDLSLFCAQLCCAFFSLCVLREFLWRAADGDIDLTAGVAAGITAPLARAFNTISSLHVGKRLDMDAGATTWLRCAACAVTIHCLISLTDSAAAAGEVVGAGVATALVSVLRGHSLSEDTAAIGAPTAAKGTAPVLKRMTSMSSVATGGNLTQSIGWLGSVGLEQPSWTASFAASVGPGSQAIDITTEAALGADALYMAASIMAFLVAYSQEEKDASSLPESVQNSVQQLATMADDSTSVAGTASTVEKVEQAVNTLLQAALVTYSRFSKDPVVYANFRDLVDAAGVGGEELIAAVDVIRGSNGLMRNVLMHAPTRSSSSAGSAIVSAVLKPFNAHVEGSFMARLESDPDFNAAKSAAEAAISAKLTNQKDYMRTMFELCTAARRKILLLEAVSLSPFLAWGIVAINGIAPILELIALVTTAVSLHNDIDPAKLSRAAASTMPPALLMERMDDVLSHAMVTLSHLCRVGLEHRQTGYYKVPFEEEDDIRIPASLDGHIVPQAVFTRETAGTACSAVLASLATGHPLQGFTRAASSLLGWQASIVNVTVARGDASIESDWSSKYLDLLLTIEFMESMVALLRNTISDIGKATGSNAAGKRAAGQPHEVHGQLTSLFLSLQHVAVHKPGSIAIATRGASRQVLRAIPLILADCGDSRSGSAYECLVAALRVLHTSISTGGAERSSEDGGTDAAPSVGALLHKQGLVDYMIQVVFSSVGITSALGKSDSSSFAIYGEACQLALAIVSAVSTKKDVAQAASLLTDAMKRTTGAVEKYVKGAQLEAALWSSVSGTNSSSLAGYKRTQLVLDVAGGTSSESASQGENAESMEAANANTLLGAIQLFGLLIVTDAGRRAGLDIALQGMAACAALAQSGLQYIAASVNLHQAVQSAIAAATTTSDDAKGPGPLTGALASASALALAPISKQESDVVWGIASVVQTIRIAMGVLMEMSIAQAVANGIHDLDGGSALTRVCTSMPDVQNDVQTTVASVVAVMDMINGGSLKRLDQVASGAALIAAIPSKAKGILPMALPAASLLLSESAATLAVAAEATTCAVSIPPACADKGVDICLAVLTGALSGSISTEALELIVHMISTFYGIARAGSLERKLSVAGVPGGAMRSLGEILQAISQAQDDKAVDFLVQGVANALLLLSHLSLAQAACMDLVAGGITSFLRSSLLLCGDDTSSMMQRPQLMQGIAIILQYLCAIGHCMAPESASEGEDTTLAITLRELVGRVAGLAAAGKSYADSAGCFHQIVRTLICYGEAQEFVPVISAEATIATIKEAAPRLLQALRRAMANADATPGMLADCRTLIALLADKEKKREETVEVVVLPPPVVLATEVIVEPIIVLEEVDEPPAAVEEEAEPSQAPTEAADEVLEAIEACRKRIGTVHNLFLDADVRGNRPDAVAVETEAGYLAHLEACVEALRTLAVIIPGYFPCAQMDGIAMDPLPTKALLRDVFTSGRDYITSSMALFANAQSAPRSKKLMLLLYDAINASLPIVTRAAAYAFQHSDFGAVRIVDALAVIGQAMDSHAVPLQRTIFPSTATRDPDVSVPCSYTPIPSAIDQVCKAMRTLAAVAPTECLSQCVAGGQLLLMLRLVADLRQLKARAEDPKATGDREQLRVVSGDAERCAASLAGAIRSLLTKSTDAQKEETQSDGGDNALKHAAVVLTPMALAGVLRATAMMSVSADEDAKEDALEEREDGREVAIRTRAADSVLFSQVKAIMDAPDGVQKIFKVMEHVGSQTLAGASLSGPSGVQDVSIQLKMFHTILSILDEYFDLDKEDATVKLPANMSVLRGLYASIINAMQIVMGEGMLNATHSSALAALYHDPAAEEFADQDQARKADAAVETWAVLPDAKRVDTSEASAARVEDL